MDRFPVILCVLATALAMGCVRSEARPILSCEAPVTFADGKSPGRIRHVATTGSDASGDGSSERPFRTLARAAQEIVPGTAVFLHPGTYQGGTALAAIHGTASDPIWIMGVPGEARPLIQGGNQGIYLTKPRYVILRQLEIVDTADNGINVDDGDEVSNPEAARFIVFVDLDIHDTGQHPSGVAACLKLAGVNDFFVLNSRFARCGRGTGSGAVGVNGVGTHRGRVSANVFRDTGYGGVQFKGASSDLDILGNRFDSTGLRAVSMGGSTGRQFFRPALSPSTANYEAARMHVSANVFVSGETAASFAGCVDCTFTHNTVVDPSKWALRILQETVGIDRYSFAPSENGLVADNVFFFRRADLTTGEDINVGADTDTRSVSLARNVWYAHDDPSASRPRLATFRGSQVGSVEGIRPQFVDEAAQDFRVKSDGNDGAAGATAPCAPAK